MNIKELIIKIRDYCLKNAKIIFPVIIVLAVAITVFVALVAHHEKEVALQEQIDAENQAVLDAENSLEVNENVEMVANDNSEIYSLVCTYYNAWATGDEESLKSVCDEISDQDLLRFVETAKYIDHYPELQVFVKPGPEAGSTIAFVYYRVVFIDYKDEFPAYQAHYICTRDDGSLYIKRSVNSKEVDDAIQLLISQDDVVEFNNKITVEYNNLMAEKPELLDYLSNLDATVSQAVGEQLAQSQGSVSSNDVGDTESENVAPSDENAADNENNTDAAEAANTQNVYATATTTVNVRVSDSEKADKLGKVSGGTKVRVIENKLNGWSCIEFEDKQGYIKTEFLNMLEALDESEIIGSVTATTNINVRSSASETADRIGVLAGGESVELLSKENGWCKISYNGQIGYVKAEYVE